MTSDNPYKPPSTDEAPPSPALPWRTLFLTVLGWVFAASLVMGVVGAVRTHGALVVFGAEARVAGVVAVGALRVVGPNIAVLGSSLAVVVSLNRATVEPTARLLPVAYLCAPLTTPVSSLLITGSCLLTTSALGADVSTSWHSVSDMVLPIDLFVGIATATCHALATSAAAAISFPALSAIRSRLSLSVGAAIIGTSSIVLIVATVLRMTVLGEATSRS